MFESIFIEIADYLKNCKPTNDRTIDKKCHDIFIKYIETNNKNIIGYISQEEEELKFINTKNNKSPKYILAFDPLDGSSNLSSNITTGSIYGVYEYDEINNKLLDIVGAGYCIYGPKTVMVYTNKDKLDVKILINNEFIFNRHLSFDNMNKNNNEKIYSINHSNDYDKEVNYLLQCYRHDNYNMRWVGTLVADAHRILLNDGIFYYPTSKKYPHGKIRCIYQGYPLSYIFKIAGGVGLNTGYISLLKYIKTFDLTCIHKRMPIILASKKEYDKLLFYLELQDDNC